MRAPVQQRGHQCAQNHMSEHDSLLSHGGTPGEAICVGGPGSPASPRWLSSDFSLASPRVRPSRCASFLVSEGVHRQALGDWQNTLRALHRARTLARTRRLHASNASSAWKCVTCPAPHMLGTPVPCHRSPGRLDTQLHHKCSLGRERRWGLGHTGPLVILCRDGACFCCPWHARTIQCARRLRPRPKRLNWGARRPGSV